ncbi:hypothetical protein [Tellurirhabdus rosea]|uniref:hypothetical protein n=1 Tax=Tellurirhabdus rosea TaxID=2674997 RepID=UPI0022505E44|nr:hypothetical protein [Tellurirhabdus rosea]
MKNAWIGVVILAAGITLEGMAQEAGSRTGSTSGTATKDKSANQKSSVKKTPGTNNGGEPANVGANGRRFGTSDNPNPGYSSGSGQQGKGKMKSGQSRSGNSNLQTGSTKSGDVSNDPNVTSGQKRPVAPGGSGDAGSDTRNSGGRAYRSGSEPASGGRQGRVTHTYTQGSTSNTTQGAMSSGAVTNVDDIKVNHSNRSEEGMTGKVGSGDEDVNGSTYRRRLSGKGQPATSASTTDGKSGGSGKASSKDSKHDRGIGPNAIPPGQGGTGPSGSGGTGGSAPGGGSAGGNAGDAASTGQAGQASGAASAGRQSASGGSQASGGTGNGNTQKTSSRSTTSTSGRSDLYNAQKGSTTGPSGNSNSSSGGNASQRANQSIRNEKNKNGNQ